LSVAKPIISPRSGSTDGFRGSLNPPYGLTKRSSGLKKGAAACLPCRSLHSRLAAADALRGESERAAAELAEARRLNGDLSSSIAQMKAGGSRVVPKIRALYEATYFAGLRKAGMPDE
jgi:hypothetical protein